jgi:hypothetical protein
VLHADNANGRAAFPNAGQTFAIIVPGMITAPITNLGSRIVNAGIANFFRPSAPNYFPGPGAFRWSRNAGGLEWRSRWFIANAGNVSPFGSINAQTSDGDSTYNALNVDVKKRFSHNFQFLASYTWSHSIDDSSDLQTLLLPQDNRNFAAERADSLFDQRHRFVFSGLLSTPGAWVKEGGWRGRCQTLRSLRFLKSRLDARSISSATRIRTTTSRIRRIDLPCWLTEHSAWRHGGLCAFDYQRPIYQRQSRSQFRCDASFHVSGHAFDEDGSVRRARQVGPDR